ncbi:lytic transglycosylase domain-containing protein [Roseinatronobacter sp.]
MPDRTGMHPSQPTRRTLAHSARPAPASLPALPTPPVATAAEPIGTCIAEILRAQQRYGIPDNLLLGIGLQEAGTSRGGRLTVWPWAVNAAGEGRLFDTRQAAMAWVRERQQSGVQSIDVGCLQINLRWHPNAFANLEQGFDPAINVDYAARFLRGLYAETGDWMRAAGAYHSRTPDLAAIYLASLRRNVAVANDRIAAFHTLAGARAAAHSSPPVTQRADAPLSPQTPIEPRTTPWDHGYWSTQTGDAGGVYGIYSRERLEPILPKFQQHF